MTAAVETGCVITPGIYHDLTNEQYHSGPGVSKSQLDDIAISPATYIWRKNAPLDEEKLQALDMGTALHCLLLEPDEFAGRFIVAPEFNRRTNQGKEDEAKFLADCALTGKTVMTAEEGRKLTLMHESVMAHPDARTLLEAEGHSEASIFWTDEHTGELCRIRPDRMLTKAPVIIDVKKVDDMSRFPRHAEEFRYHVQQAMYCDGFLKHFGEMPDFLFLAVSSSVDCGRYPVMVCRLPQEWVDDGHTLYRRNLERYHQCRLTNDWRDIITLTRPSWARSAA